VAHLPNDSTSEKGGSSQRKSSRIRRDAGTGQLDITTMLRVLKVLIAGARHLRH